MINAFTITNKEKVYNCYSIVSGTKELSQAIVVEGIGEKNDPALYSHKHHPVETMTSIAKIIAHEIVNRESTED